MTQLIAKMTVICFVCLSAAFSMSAQAGGPGDRMSQEEIEFLVHVGMMDEDALIQFQAPRKNSAPTATSVMSTPRTPQGHIGDSPETRWRLAGDTADTRRISVTIVLTSCFVAKRITLPYEGGGNRSYGLCKRFGGEHM